MKNRILVVEQAGLTPRQHADRLVKMAQELLDGAEGAEYIYGVNTDLLYGIMDCLAEYTMPIDLQQIAEWSKLDLDLVKAYFRSNDALEEYLKIINETQ